MTPPDRDGPPFPPPGREYGLCAILVVLSVAVHGWMIGNTSVTARDSVGFARYALNLGDPNAGRDGMPTRTHYQLLRDEKHPPGYPAAVWLASLAVRPVYSASLPEQMLRSAQVASAVAAVFLVIPMFRLGKLLFDRWVGFWAALLFQLLPVVARDTSDGLSDGPFLLAACWAVLFGVSGMAGAGVGAFFRCGLAAGCAYLIRPEGLVLVVAGVFTVLVAVGRRTIVPHAGAIRVALLLTGTLLVGGPYMLVIRDITNKTPMLETASDDTARLTVGPLFAESIPADATTAMKCLLVPLAVAKEWFKAGHYGVAAVALLGLVLTFPRARREPRFWFPLAFIGVHLAVLLAVGFKKGYVSERHLLPVVMAGVLFAVGGLPVWLRLWAPAGHISPVFTWRHWPVAITVILAFTCLPPLARPLHENRIGHKRAGAVLREEIDRLQRTDPARAAGLVVIDHYEWAQFFAERSLYRVPPDPAGEAQKVVYVVLELKDGSPETPVFDSDRHKAAVAIFNDPANPPQWVYHWPEDAPRDQAKVVLVKQVRP